MGVVIPHRVNNCKDCPKLNGTICTETKETIDHTHYTDIPWWCPFLVRKEIKLKVICISVAETAIGYSYDFDLLGNNTSSVFSSPPYGHVNFGTTEQKEFEPGKKYTLTVSDEA